MQIEWKSCIRVATVAFVLFLAIYYWKSACGFVGAFFSAATPVIIGVVIAYILNILMSFYEGFYFTKSKNKWIKKTKRPVCMVLAMLTFVLIVAIVVRLVIPELVSCIKLLVSLLPGQIEKLLDNEWVANGIPENIYKELSAIDWKNYISQVAKIVQSGIGSTFNTIVSAVSILFSGLLTSFLAFIFSIYFLLDKEHILEQLKKVVKRYIPEKITKKLSYVGAILNDSFHKYIVGQCTEAVILGVLCIIGMWIFRFPYPLMIGCLIGFTALIPVAGAYIGAGVGFVMILTVSPLKAILFLVFIAVLQQLEGNLIYPKVVGGSLGLPAVWVLAAVTIGGGLLGVLGMLIGVPLASALYRIIKEDVKKEPIDKEKKKIEIMKQE